MLTGAFLTWQNTRPANSEGFIAIKLLNSLIQTFKHLSGTLSLLLQLLVNRPCLRLLTVVGGGRGHPGDIQGTSRGDPSSPGA